MVVLDIQYPQRQPKSLFGAPHSEILVQPTPTPYTLYSIYTNNDTYIRLLAALAAPLDTFGCLFPYHWTWDRE